MMTPLYIRQGEAVYHTKEQRWALFLDEAIYDPWMEPMAHGTTAVVRFLDEFFTDPQVRQIRWEDLERGMDMVEGNRVAHEIPVDKVEKTIHPEPMTHPTRVRKGEAVLHIEPKTKEQRWGVLVGEVFYNKVLEPDKDAHMAEVRFFDEFFTRAEPVEVSWYELERGLDVVNERFGQGGRSVESFKNDE